MEDERLLELRAAFAMPALGITAAEVRLARVSQVAEGWPRDVCNVVAATAHAAIPHMVAPDAVLLQGTAVMARDAGTRTLLQSPEVCMW
jgi:hypothetical protein